MKYCFNGFLINRQNLNWVRVRLSTKIKLIAKNMLVCLYYYIFYESSFYFSGLKCYTCNILENIH